MSRKTHQDRRRFLQQSIASAAVWSATASGFLTPRHSLASGDLTRRRHLISIMGFGGWDSHWFHSAFRASDLDAIDPSIKYISESTTAIPDSVPASTLVKLSVRHPEGEGMLHPTSSSTYLGAGMKAIFNAEDLSHMLLWKGMTKDGDHGVSNQIILHGQISTYALSYSSLIAQGLKDHDYLRPLHYVQVSATPGALGTQVAMASGAQLPINIPDQNTFRLLTSVNPNESSDVTRRNLLNDSIRKLSSTVSMSRFKINTGKKLFTSFSDSFSGFLAIGGTNLGNSIELRWLRKFHAVTTAQAMVDIFNNTSTQIAVRVNSHLPGKTAEIVSALGAISPMPDLGPYLALKRRYIASPLDQSLIAQVAAMETALAPLVDDIDAGGPTSNATFTQIKSSSFGFAMADFLVQKDISAVVDLGSPCGDGHDRNLDDVFNNAIAFCAYRQLIRSLKSGILADGRNILDITTVVMSTDFDREPYLSVRDPSLKISNPGTSHGYSVSMVLAGGMIRGGTVVGDLRTGRHSIGDYGAFNGPHLYSNPLPIDTQTGVPSPTGKLISPKSILPTLLSIYGLQPPDNQVTDAGVVAAVIKS